MGGKWRVVHHHCCIMYLVASSKKIKNKEIVCWCFSPVITTSCTSLPNRKSWQMPTNGYVRISTYCNEILKVLHDNLCHPGILCTIHSRLCHPGILCTIHSRQYHNLVFFRWCPHSLTCYEIKPHFFKSSWKKSVETAQPFEGFNLDFKGPLSSFFFFFFFLQPIYSNHNWWIV